MNSTQTPPSASPFDVPQYLKRILDWWKILGIPVAVVGTIGSYFLNKDDAWFMACLSAAFFVALYFVILFTLNSQRAVRLAQKILTTAGDPNTKEQKELANYLKYAPFVSIFLLVVAVGSLALLFYPPISYKLRTARPDKVEFESIGYFDPSRDQALLHDSPFLEAVVVALKDEGKAENKQTGIVLGTTKPFDHPTPALQLSISVDDNAQEVAGYAFRRHQLRQRVLYDPVPINYNQAGFVIFSLPPCDPGDRLFFVGRLSLTGKGAPFPDNLHLQEDIKLRVSEAP